MKFVFKKIIAALILLSFLIITIFSFALMVQGPDGRMTGDCPFQAMGVSLCPQNTFAAVIHHISAYQAFFGVPVGVGITLTILSLFFAIGVGVIFSYLKLLGPPALARVLHNEPPAGFQNREIIHWLSLFENSPSII